MSHFNQDWRRGHRDNKSSTGSCPSLAESPQGGSWVLPSDLVIPCPLFPGTFSVAPMPSSPLLSVTSVLFPSKPGASTFPMAEDSAPLLAYTRTKGQKQWTTHSLISSPQWVQGSPRFSACSVDSPGTKAPRWSGWHNGQQG